MRGYSQLAKCPLMPGNGWKISWFAGPLSMFSTCPLITGHLQLKPICAKQNCQVSLRQRVHWRQVLLYQEGCCSKKKKKPQDTLRQGSSPAPFRHDWIRPEICTTTIWERSTTETTGEEECSLPWESPTADQSFVTITSVEVLQSQSKQSYCATLLPPLLCEGWGDCPLCPFGNISVLMDSAI